MITCEDFNQTKKGDRRKTVSSRRAYVNTTSEIRKKLAVLQKIIIGKGEYNWRVDGVSPSNAEEALNLIKELSSQLLYGK